MATVRRHWKAFAVAALVALCVCAAMVMPLLRSAPAMAQATDGDDVEGPPAEAGSGTDPVVYARLRDIRRQLAMADLDLAAAGCDAEAAEAVLSALCTWHDANVTALSAADADVIGKLLILNDLERSDEASGAAVSEASSDYYAAKKARQELWERGMEPVAQHLTSAQVQILAAARDNAGVEAPYKYLADLTEAQKAIILTQRIEAMSSTPMHLAWRIPGVTTNQATNSIAYSWNDDILLAWRSRMHGSWVLRSCTSGVSRRSRCTARA